MLFTVLLNIATHSLTSLTTLMSACDLISTSTIYSVTHYNTLYDTIIKSTQSVASYIHGYITLRLCLKMAIFTPCT